MTTKTGIIFLQREKFQIYSPYLPSVFEFRFIPDIVRDFDIANRELFENLLKVFIVNNKIPVGSMIIVVADNASFVKEFITPPAPPNPQQPAGQPAPTAPTLEDLQTQAHQFIEHIPFDSVAGKTYPLPNGVRAYATNQEMFEVIKNILEKQGFIVDAVFPGLVFGPEVSSKPGLDGTSVGIILQKINLVKEYNLLSQAKSEVETFTSRGEAEEAATSGDEKPPVETKAKNKRSILIAIIGFVLLFAITGWIIAGQFAEKPNKTPPAAKPSSAPSAPVNTATSSATFAPTNSLTVQITGTSVSAGNAEALRVAFGRYGFRSVSSQTQANIGTSSELLIFSEKVSPEIKTAVTAEVKKVAPNVIVQQASGSVFDITILLGK